MAPSRAPRGRKDIAASAAGEEEGPTGWRRRARAFVFGEQAEHERFGVFDPFFRWTYVVLTFIAAVLLSGSLIEITAAQAVGLAGAAAIFVAVIIGAWRMHRKIWVKPSEREILLQMAREDDEARALRERIDREDAARSAQGQSQRKVVDRPGHR